MRFAVGTAAWSLAGCCCARTTAGAARAPAVGRAGLRTGGEAEQIAGRFMVATDGQANGRTRQRSWSEEALALTARGRRGRDSQAPSVFSSLGDPRGLCGRALPGSLDASRVSHAGAPREGQKSLVPVLLVLKARRHGGESDDSCLLCLSVARAMQFRWSPGHLNYCALESDRISGIGHRCWAQGDTNGKSLAATGFFGGLRPNSGFLFERLSDQGPLLAAPPRASKAPRAVCLFTSLLRFQRLLLAW